MYEADSGATHAVGQVQVWGGKQFAYGGLVDELVAEVSRPFQVSWVRP